MDKNLSGWAHFPIFLWIIGPLIVWPAAKDKETKFQIKQAFAWQLLWLIILGVLWIATVVTLNINVALGLILKVGTYLLAIFALTYSIYGSYKCFDGSEFKYPIVSSYIKK
jgi:uncharacterized Tic20 family protein